MRQLLVLSALLFLVNGVFAQTKVASAKEVLGPVYAKAAKENKKVLVIFHASWCGWCRKMDSSLNDKTVKPLIDRYFEITHLTVKESPNKKALENPGAEELLNKFGGADQGLPYWAVLYSSGELITDSQYKPGENVGCPASEEEVDYFITVLRKTTTLKNEELEIIQKRFRKNEQ